MSRSAPILAIIAVVSGGPLPAEAQMDHSQVDQILPRPGGRAVDQIPRVESGSAIASQLPKPSSGGSRQSGQITRPGAPPGVPAQLSERDRNPLVVPIPPEMVDACEEAAADRRPAPDVVDCSVVLEAVAFTAQPTPSAEQALLRQSENAQVEQASRAALGRSADADVIASRLGTGDVQGSAAAQAIGSGSVQGNLQAPPLPKADVKVIVTGPSGAVVVSPGGR
jgi:hypothetical protein